VIFNEYDFPSENVDVRGSVGFFRRRLLPPIAEFEVV